MEQLNMIVVQVQDPNCFLPPQQHGHSIQLILIQSDEFDWEQNYG